LLLFIRLRAYERLPRWDADGRARLRREVWALSTQLTVLFASRVAAATPSWPVTAAAWAMAVLTTVGGFVAMIGRDP